MSELPKGWTIAAVGDLIDLGPRNECDENLEVGFVPLQRLGVNYRSYHTFERRPWKDVKKGYTHFTNGDVLLARITPCFENGKAGIVRNLPSGIGAGSTEYFVCRPNGGVIPEYLLAHFKTRKFLLNGELVMTGAVGQQRVPKQYILESEMPLPPLPEQKRIADKLDSLLARVDACRERLDRVPGILKRFRQAILIAATSGRLTEGWRDNPDNDTEADLPATWLLCQIADVGRVQLGRQRAPKFHTGSNMKPYLRVQNVFEDRIDLNDVMEMDFPGDDFEKYQLHPGDILLNEGQSPEYLGRPAMFKGELVNACFTNTLIRFQAGEKVLPAYALLVFRHHMHSGRYIAEGNITTNIAHLGAGRFAAVEFPLPPKEEQHEIVRRVESLFAYADALEARYKAARAQVDRLTPALLAKAFRGELVPQDPNDEPAEALLVRIRAEKAEAGPSKTAKAKSPKSRAPKAGITPSVPPESTAAPAHTQADPQAALQVLLHQKPSWLTADGLIRAMAQHLGIQRLGARIKADLQAAIKGAIQSGQLHRHPDGSLSLPE